MAREVDIDKRGLLHCPTSGWWGLLCQSNKHPDLDVLDLSATKLLASQLYSGRFDIDGCWWQCVNVGGSGEC